MNTETISIKKLKPNPANPRTIKDDKFHKLVQSVKDFPEMLELRPIVVNDQLEVLGGNMRLRACIEAGMKEVTIIRASELTEDQQREFIIKDNVGFGEWDMDALANEWDAEELQEWGVDLPGDFGGGGSGEAQEDDYEIPDEIKTDIVLGDLFEIGEHRLLCGDSADREQVERLMGGENAGVVITDPPYGINLKYVGVMANNTNGEVIGDALDFDPSHTLSIPANCYYIFGADYFLEKLPSRKGLCVWAKAHSDKENLVFGASFETFWRSHKDKREIWYESRINALPENMHKHPTQKPLSLIIRCIQDSGADGYIIDPYIGSGTTMVAAHQLNRRCFGMEIEPKYCQVIIDRMLKLDPTLEIKKNGQPYNISELATV